MTDRHALTAAVGARVDPLAALLAQIASAIDAGVDLVQLRERDLEAGQLCDLAGECVARARGSGTRILVNDRFDVAMAAGASGVHLRGDSIDSSRVRALAPPGFLVGRSIRSATAASMATFEDYLVFGTVFPTPSKAGLDQVAGVDELARAVAAARVPVLAIGGVAPDRLGEVARAGAAGVAAIRLFFPAGVEPGDLARRVAEWRRAFDTNRPIT